MTEIDLSFVIITFNEENNLKRCLASLPKGAEIVVLDSGSSDQTLIIANEFGATVKHRDFDNFSKQKNAAIDLATRSWVFSIDADEELDSNLSHTLTQIIETNPKENAFKIQRELVFMEKKMRFGKTKDMPIRLFKKGKAEFAFEIHEVLQVENNLIGKIPGTLFHYSYKNIEDYFNRFNSYTTKVALNHFKNKKKSPSTLVLCLRPFSDFIIRYFLRLGFLDGYAGFCYALYSSIYAFTKYSKLVELKSLKNGNL